MSKQYSFQKFEEIFKKAIAKPDSFYQNPLVNWQGRFSDLECLYSDKISEELLQPDNFMKISEIVSVPREKDRPYLPRSDRSPQKGSSNRLEERFAKLLVNKNLADLGQVFNYQVPLKATRKTPAGKIDLVTRTAANIFLVELKGPFNRQDTLLRSVLEVWTYSKQICREKFLQEFKAEFPCSFALNDIKPAVLLFPGTLAFEEAEEMTEKGNCNRQHLKALVTKLGVLVFTFTPLVVRIE